MAEEMITAAETAAEESKAPAKKTTRKAPAKKAAGETTKKASAKKAEGEAPAKKAPAKKAAKKAEATLTIKLVKSLIGRGEKQIATAKALGLKKAGDTTVQPDNAATRGKINKISHLVEVTNA